MKVALITEVISTIGGVEARVKKMRELLSESYDIKLYSSETIIGVPTIVNPPKRSMVRLGFFMIKLFFRLLMDDYDIMDVQGHVVFLPSFIISKLRRKRMIATIHDLYLNDFGKMYASKLSILGRFYEIFLIKLSCEKVTVNSTLAKTLNAHNIPNGVDNEFIKNVKTGKKKDQIIFVGRLVPQKNISLVIYANLIDKGRKLIIVGSGQEEKHCKDIIKVFNSDNIMLIKKVSYHDLIRMIKESKVLVLPSLRESMGIVLIEAMACGTPVITTETDGTRDFVFDRKNGLITTNNMFVFMNRIDEVFEDNKLCRKLVKNGYITAKKYDWKIMAKRIGELYELGY